MHQRSNSPPHKVPGYTCRIGRKAYEKVAGTQEAPRSGPDAFYSIKSFVDINNENRKSFTMAKKDHFGSRMEKLKALSKPGPG